jgi:hypothetical protein
MATLEISKVKTKITTSWVNMEVEELKIFNGQVYVIPKNKKYQHFNILLENCIIIKP